MTTRPAVAVIVPFAGTDADLAQCVAALSELRSGEGDELIVADNRPGASTHAAGRVQVVAAAGLRTPAFARNRGAEAAKAEWLVFIDADTEPAPDLIDAMFDPMPDRGTAVLAGEIVDVAASSRVAARHAVARRRLSQRTTLERPGFGYAQSANCAVRTVAFVSVGGFVDSARAAEDADLCFRLRAAGWELEYRPGAVVRHLSRNSVRASLEQLVRHGSGAGWLNRRYPGAMAAPRTGEFARTLGHYGRSAAAAAARGQREAAAFALLDLAGALAFAAGRWLPNQRGFTGGRPGEPGA